MSITSKLQYLKNTKELIKQSLIDKGVQVSDTDSFRSYADKISSITSDDGASDDATNTVLNPTTIFNGISYYVDTQCNTRHGYDASTPKLEPLIITPNDSETSSCNYSTVYASGYTGSWTNDGFLNLGSAGGFKTNHRTYNDKMTVEVLFRLNENSVDEQCTIFHACNPSITKCASTHASYPNKLVCTGITTDTFELDELFDPEINKIYYLVNTYDASTTTTTLIILPDNKRWSASLKKFETGLSNYTTCVGTSNYKTTTIATADLHSDGLEIGMVRCWNRVLSDEEIQENYKELKNRFGF